ncbi:MAG: DUF4406 domain-containing protein [Hydrogenophaga sp.]|uniref:DUF4406 domain-containing protein n=1 Tax=Hydrogenophaga sp. TaxID=1904254 RepID=UPI0040373424
MIPVDQEFVHKPEEGQFGDCQRAVLASLLELPREQVPHFNQIARGDPTVFWETLQAFCRTKGFVYLTVSKNAGSAFFGDEGPIYHEINGPSPRGGGVSHAVVGRNGEIVFDPHPSRAGLAGNPAEWQHAYLVRSGQASRSLDLDATSRSYVQTHIEAEREQWTGVNRVYVAGPMTGIPDLNFPAFHRQATRLRARGIDVVNPAEINTDPSAKWTDCMRADIRELVGCDSIAMLPGWDRSKGATLEHHIAQSLELRVIYLL